MIRLAISVEGETEEEFVKSVLVPQLGLGGMECEPVLLKGNVTVPRLGGEMARLLDDHDFVTSLVDFYGFQNKQSHETPSTLETRIAAAIRTNVRQNYEPGRAFPYVQQYEFEALLFSDVNAFASLPRVSGRTIDGLKVIRDQFPTPEDINDSPDTAPSKRIQRVIPRYEKINHGNQVAEAIGLGRIRAECPRFNSWLAHLESLGSSSGFA